MGAPMPCRLCPVVKPDRYAYLDHMRNVHQMAEKDVLITEAIADLHNPAEPLHATTADTQPNQNGPGGVWMVGCETCGWTKVGSYSGILIDEPLGLRHAHRAGTAHEAAMNGRVEWS